MRSQQSYKWYGTWVDDYDGADAANRHGIDPKDYGKCDHALVVDGDDEAYEIGVVASKTEPGSFQLVYDFYGENKGQKLKRRIGGEGERLKQSYTKYAALNSLTLKGFKLSNETRLDNGSIQLTLKTYG